MKLSLFTDNIDEYLKKDGVVNYENVNIIQLADLLWSNADMRNVFLWRKRLRG